MNYFLHIHFRIRTKHKSRVDTRTYCLYNLIKISGCSFKLLQVEYQRTGTLVISGTLYFLITYSVTNF